MEYKVGDRVLVSDGFFSTAWVGVITEADPNAPGHPYEILGDDALVSEPFYENPGDDPVFPLDYIIGKVADR